MVSMPLFYFSTILYTCIHEQYLGNIAILQKMRQDIKERMKGTMVTSQVPPAPEPAERDSTVPSDTSPPQVLKFHHQHLANYVKLFLEEGEDLIMGDDKAAPLVTEVFIHCFTIYDWSFILVSFYLIHYVFDSLIPIFRLYKKSDWHHTLNRWQGCCMLMWCSN